MCNLFGYIPAPFIYGLINDYAKNNRLAMFIGIYYSFVGLISMSLGTYFRYRDYDKIYSHALKDKESEKEKEIDKKQNRESNFITRRLSHQQEEFYGRKSSLPNALNLLFQGPLGKELIDNELEKENEENYNVQGENIENNLVVYGDTIILERANEEEVSVVASCNESFENDDLGNKIQNCNYISPSNPSLYNDIEKDNNISIDFEKHSNYLEELNNKDRSFKNEINHEDSKNKNFSDTS